MAAASTAPVQTATTAVATTGQPYRPGGTGTYAVDANCKGTLQFGPPGPSFDIFVAPKGGELWMIQTNPNNAFQGHVKKVS